MNFDDMVVKYREMERGEEHGGATDESDVTHNLLSNNSEKRITPVSNQKDSPHIITMDDDDDDDNTDEIRGFLPNGKALLVAAAASLSGTPVSSAGAGASGAQLFRNRFSVKNANSRRLRKRVVFKNGDCNVVQANVAKRRRRYLADIFTTLVDIQWRWNLMVFSMGFILSWLGFAIIWWLICFTHGDLEHFGDENWKPCVFNVHSFTAAFLFSIETQHTIGYGSRYTTETCPEAIIVMCVQSITGVMIQAFMVGVVFAKLSRPKKRTQTLLFSRQSVICERDGKLCLLFRVGDMRKSHIIQTNMRAQLIKKKVTSEGELIPHHLHDIKIGYDHGENQIFFIWPLTIIHVIDEKSPFYTTTARDLLRDNFELVVILEGCIESTGMTTQARSSYLPGEILWGHRFDEVVSYRRDTGEYAVDYGRFNSTHLVETPLCSAKDLDDWRRMGGTGLPPKKKLFATKPLMRSKSVEDIATRLNDVINEDKVPAILPSATITNSTPVTKSNGTKKVGIRSANPKRKSSATKTPNNTNATVNPPVKESSPITTVTSDEENQNQKNAENAVQESVA